MYKRDGITDGQTDRRTDDPNTRCPRRTFQAGGIKNKPYFTSSLRVLEIAKIGLGENLTQTPWNPHFYQNFPRSEKFPIYGK